MRSTATGLCSALFLAIYAIPASACGGEVPIACDVGEKNDARWLLKRAVSAVEHNKSEALQWFSEQSHGYRTMDLYVFCIGPNNQISAHPDAAIRGVDASTLEDATGKRFAATMISQAKADAISDITYMWPRLESSKPSVKHTMYERVSDQICAVGYYE